MLQPLVIAPFAARDRLRANHKLTLKGVPVVSTIFMGVDGSLTSTGVAVVQNGVLRTHRLAPALRGADRLCWFHVEFSRLLSYYRPAQVAIEGYAFGARGQAHQLGELGGIFRFTMALHEVPYHVVPPTSLKMFATGAGSSEKGAVSKELFKRYDVDLSNNDEVDAAGLALMAMAMDKETGFNLTAFQRKSLSKLTK